MIKKIIFTFSTISVLFLLIISSYGFKNSSPKKNNVLNPNPKNMDTLTQSDGPYIFEDFYIVVDEGRIIRKKIKDPIFKVFNKDKKFSFKITLNTNYNIDKPIFSAQKILAVSDIEGNFKVFSEFLINNKVIDENFNWIFGNGHLVLNGDFFDRGEDVTACLWLIYKLEQEAYKQGGKVHFILGNHEAMNLRGDARYARSKYTFLADELLDIPHKKLYGEASELGKWLRTKNSVIKINNILFAHAGISPGIVGREYSLEEINRITREYLGEETDYMEFLGPRVSYIFESNGPRWYRGYFVSDDDGDYQKATAQDIDRILDYFNSDHIVVGHTVVKKVETFYNNKVIDIDAIPENDPKRNDAGPSLSCQGLYIEGQTFYRALFDGKKEKLFKDNKTSNNQ